ncbi:MAG TPA: hypothetical protein VFN11_14185 [Ktedonobacterales bacterium]|nr:hypothetical protein [Ktedonobacterales bacterium]
MLDGGGGFGLLLQLFLHRALDLLSEERLLLPEQRLLQQVPGGDAEVFGGTNERVPVREDTEAAIGQEVALKGDVLGIPAPVNA